ncbi:MAG: GAF domain-containing protein, partial [Chloroflexi bacterium]|nr:GAF domain-containing protein [Chloroflexota bacterium]
MDSEKTSTKRDTNQLKNDKKQTTIYPHRDEGYFVPIPHPERRYGTTAQPVWRVSFELLSDPSVGVGVDINDEVYLGRSGSSADIIDLKPLGAQERGVSRRHAILRPYANKLFILDNDSTNGTWKNGIDIGKKTPYSLVSGDVITLGHLELVIRIVERPKHSTDLLNKKVDLADALTSLAKTITAQLELDEVLNQTLSMAMELTAAQQAAIWLVDEATSYLDLAASRGIEGTGDMRIRGNNPMVAEVIKSGKAKKTSSDDPDIKVKTGLLVSSVLYVPMTLGGVTFGVLMAANKEEKDSFSERDETLLTAIGDFAAIAVQNARQFEATDRELARRVGELSALNELSLVISTSLDMGVIYDELKHQITRHFEDTVVTLWLADEKLQELIN